MKCVNWVLGHRLLPRPPQCAISRLVNAAVWCSGPTKPVGTGSRPVKGGAGGSLRTQSSFERAGAVRCGGSNRCQEKSNT